MSDIPWFAVVLYAAYAAPIVFLALCMLYLASVLDRAGTWDHALRQAPEPQTSWTEEYFRRNRGLGPDDTLTTYQDFQTDPPRTIDVSADAATTFERVWRPPSRGDEALQRLVVETGERERFSEVL